MYNGDVGNEKVMGIFFSWRVYGKRFGLLRANLKFEQAVF